MLYLPSGNPSSSLSLGHPTAIIASAQRVEHYDMAGYGTARTFARFPGDKSAAQQLQQTLDEEKHADEMLTKLAGEINVNAAAGETRRVA